MFKFLILVVFLIVAFSNATNYTPNQVHIALAGPNSNGMAISYQTVAKTSSSSVKFGTTSGGYTQTVQGTQSAYLTTYHHHMVLTDLTPLTTYYYVVGNDVDGWSKEFKFTSAATTDVRGNFSFLVFADLGSVNGAPSISTVDSLKDQNVLILHGGDVGYADDSFLHVGCATSFCYEQAYDTYMADIESWASQIPYMVAPGNHEAECHDPACLASFTYRTKLSNFSAYNTRFRMPSMESQGTMNMWYSFDYANIHFISLNTETDYPGAPEETMYVLPTGGFGNQLQWLEEDLKRASLNRQARPWIFVHGHHPIYTGNSINVELRDAVEDLFYQYQVDVFFTGHQHFYERNYPVYYGIPERTYENPTFTTHLLIGGSGCDEMDNISLLSQPSSSLTPPLHPPSPYSFHESKSLADMGEEKMKAAMMIDGPWTVFTDKNNHVGIGRVNIIDDDHLSFEYIRTATGEVFDSFSLTREHSTLDKRMKKYVRGKEQT